MGFTQKNLGLVCAPCVKLIPDLSNFIFFFFVGVRCAACYRKNIYSGPEQNWNTPKNRRLFQFCSVPALFWGGIRALSKKTRSATNFFCPKMHYAPGWGGNGDKNSTPTELFWAGTKLGHPQKPQVFQFCSGPVYFCLRIVTAQNKYFYGNDFSSPHCTSRQPQGYPKGRHPYSEAR